MRDEDPRLGATTALVTRAHDVRTDAAGLEHMVTAMDRTHRGVVRQLIAAEKRVAELEAEAARLRRVNHEAAQRAFFLQPGLRVRVGNFYGYTQEAPVMVPVLLDDGHHVARFDAKFVHHVMPDPKDASTWSARVDGEEQHGQASQVKVTPLGAGLVMQGSGFAAPAETGYAEELDALCLPPLESERPPFRHQPGSASDYLEALAEEVCHGPRTVESVETIAQGGTLKIHIRFDVPSKRAQLTDLLYVDQP